MFYNCYYFCPTPLTHYSSNTPKRFNVSDSLVQLSLAYVIWVILKVFHIIEVRGKRKETGDVG